MKLSKTSWLLITIGFLITAFASLGTISWQLAHQRNQLNEELAMAEAKLNGFQLEQSSYRQEALEVRLSQTLSEMETTKAMFSQPSWNIVTSILFDVAKACGTEVTVISSPGLTNKKLEGISYSVQTLTVRVEGDVLGLVSFITNLNHNLGTSVVKSVSISIPKTASEEKPSANIQLIIYTYRGD